MIKTGTNANVKLRLSIDKQFLVSLLLRIQLFRADEISGEIRQTGVFCFAKFLGSVAPVKPPIGGLRGDPGAPCVLGGGIGLPGEEVAGHAPPAEPPAAPGIGQTRSRDAANFIRLVLGCIETKFCK